MDIQKESNRDYITYGTVVSLMLDYNNTNKIATIPENFDGSMIQDKENNLMEYLKSKEFLFTHGVFNKYCFLHKFESDQEFRNGYLNTAFIVLPAFEFESMENLNKLIKKIKKMGINADEENEREGVTEKQIIDNFIKFKQEIQTNHDKSLKLMKKENNKVNYYDCIQLMHLKSGNFLEYKRNNKDLKTYIQLSNNMSKRTLFRFIPSFEYQKENSTSVFFFLSIQIACGEKNISENKLMCGPKSNVKDEKVEENPNIEKSSGLDKKDDGEEEKDEEIKINFDVEEEKPENSIFNGENLKNVIKDIYNDENLDEVIDEFVDYTVNENLIQKNFGSNLMPEDNYVIMGANKNSFWRLINLSEDYFEDVNYISLFDYFCIQSPDKNLSINVDIKEDEDVGINLLVDIINNSKNELEPIKEEKEEIQENNINNININEKSRAPKFDHIKRKSLKDSFPLFLDIKDNNLELDYYNNINVNINKYYNLLVESYDDKEHLKPFSLFRFVPINKDFEEGKYGFGSLLKFSIINEETKVRIFNNFTNKVLYVEKSEKKYKLLLIDDMPKEDRRYNNTIFQIKKLDDEDDESEESVTEREEESDNEETKESKESKKEENETVEGIKKYNFVKIYSERYHSYLGIRIKNENNTGELVLTNSIADITKFKLNCLDEEDKHEVNFFEQLLLGFNDIINYFKNEKKTWRINGKNYEKIAHFLTKFKNKLFLFQKDEKDDEHLNLQENKFDFLEIIKHFNIVSKLIDIFLANWFQNNNLEIYTYNQLDAKLKKYFEEKKDILRYKLIISKVILEILTKIYDLKQCYLNIIEDSLLYFLMFVGRDDQCTLFLVHILTDNAFLLVNLSPLYKDNLEIDKEIIEKEESINEINNISPTLISDNDEILKRKIKNKQLKFYYIKKCLERIINDYNNMDIKTLRTSFCTIIFFFSLMSSLLIFEKEPFEEFYNDYFKNLGLLKDVEGTNMIVPNYEQNPILIYFYINDGIIFAKSTPFFNKGKMDDQSEYNFKLTDLVDIMGNYNLENEESRNLLFFARLVKVNLIFYSHLSICDERFNNYLKSVFKLDNVIKNFLTFEFNILNSEDEINNEAPTKKTESPLLNEIKCAVIQIITNIYLKKQRPFISNTHLFKYINSKPNEENKETQENNEIIENKKNLENLEINKSELENIINFIIDIFEEKKVKFDINKIDHICLIQFIELIKYVLRNLYLLKNNREESIRNYIYYLAFRIVKLFQNKMGITEQELIMVKNEENKDKNLNDKIDEQKKEESLANTLNEKLELNDPMFLVSENFEYIFIKIKNRLENLIFNHNENLKEVNLFLNLLIDICDSNTIQKTRYDMELAKMKKQNKKLLKRFNLKNILMNISVDINSNYSFYYQMILFRIEEIIKEFLQYLEFATMESLGEDVQNNKQSGQENQELGENIPKKEETLKQKYEKAISDEICKNKISSKYLDEFREKMHKNSNNIISICLFKFLHTNRNEKLREIALDILFYLNSSKNIFYLNYPNLVIMENAAQYNKFLEIKNIFIELFNDIKILNRAPRIDKNSSVMIKCLRDVLENLLENLFDEDEWTRQNNCLNKEQDFQFKDEKGFPKEDHKLMNILNQSIKKIEEEDDKEIEKEEEIREKSKEKYSKISKDVLNFESIHTLEENTKGENEIEKNKSKSQSLIKDNKEYFIKQFDEESMKIFQKTLFNLDFIGFLVQFFNYIDRLTELKSGLENDYQNLEASIIAVYKILVAFFLNNPDHTSFIKLRLYLLICPLKFKNISSDLIYSINYFIFHLVYNFKDKTDYAKITHIDIVIDNLYLLHQLDWSKHKNQMPYIFKTLLMFFKYATPEHIFSIFTLLNDIKNIVVYDIKNGNDELNDIFILTRLLEFHEEELMKKRDVEENKNRPLLSMSNIIEAFPIIIKSMIPYTKNDIKKFVLAKPLILIINLLKDYYTPYYETDFENYKTEISNSLIDFCENLIIINDYIYTSENKDTKYGSYIKYFNEFMGICLPIFYDFLSSNDSISDKCEKILEKSDEFYGRISEILKKDPKETIFLDENFEEYSNKMQGNEIVEKLKYLGIVINQKQYNSNNVEDEDEDEEQEDEDELSVDIKNIDANLNNKKIEIKKSINNINDNNNNENQKEDLESKIYNLATNEIQLERKNYIEKLYYFFNYINRNNKNNDLNNNIDVSFYISFCDSFIKYFQNYVIKNRIFFFYWTNIYLMNYNQEEHKFEDNNPKYNKKYFNDLSLVKYNIEWFEKMNLNINNYENFIYIKFLNTYLCQLDERNHARFLMLIIEMPESKNIFHLLHNILDNLSNSIKNDLQSLKESKISTKLNYPEDKSIDICPSSKIEKKIDNFILAIEFLANLAENNSLIRNKMKDYLRLQYNNSKNHDFIVIAGEILQIFMNDEYAKFIPNFFFVINLIIEFLTKSCSGPCKGNQDNIVKHTKILDFIKLILQKMRYREKFYDENEENPKNKKKIINTEPKTDYIVINDKDGRRKLSYLKYKVLLLLNNLTIGRKKEDKIYDYVHQIINFDVLKSVLIETFKEILIEKGAQNNPDNFIYEEDTLSRMNDLNTYLTDTKYEKNFIIYEIGTFSYILINIYLENLTRPADIVELISINSIKQLYENDKCTVVPKSHLYSFIKSFKDYYENIKKVFKMISRGCISRDEDKDFYLKFSFNKSFLFYFKTTPHIEILVDGKLLKYYIKLSPICNCLTSEMKDEFHNKVDRTSAKTKISNLFDEVEFFRFQLIINKKILDAFSKAPILNLIFNHYQFYRNLFLIIAVIINILIFMSYYRITDDEKEVTSRDYDFQFDYGFLYEKKNIPATKKTFMVLTIIELVLAALILVNYFIFRVSYLIYYNEDKEEEDEKKKEEKEKNKKMFQLFTKNKEIFRYLIERFGNFLINLLSDVKLLYHLFLLVIIIITLGWDQRYKILSVLLLDVIERSNTLMCIVKSFWIPKKQIIVTLVLFYLVAYYFIIFVYLFIPNEVPDNECLKFSNCFFTLSDQSIKNSNGLINYLSEDGLYITDSLWSNPRFWIDNWFAILDIMLVMQMFCGIIIDTFLSQRENIREIEKDKKDTCFICGLNKTELNKYYSRSGFNEHIKLDHYLWNYMFAVFNVTSADENKMIYMDKAIKEGYEKNVYSKWVPYKKCLNQKNNDSEEKEGNEENNDKKTNNKEDDKD